jgi:ankyrin repeat protein
MCSRRNVCRQAEKIGVSNLNKRNALHLAALHATTEVMDMLAEANLLGLDPNASDKDGHSPNECFVRCRGAHCAIERKSFAEENPSWARLMRAARRQFNVSDDEEDEDEEVFEDAVETSNKWHWMQLLLEPRRLLRNRYLMM